MGQFTTTGPKGSNPPGVTVGHVAIFANVQGDIMDSGYPLNHGAASGADGAIFLTGTNMAGALAGTLTNSPVAGNPLVWVPIKFNGVTYCVPAW